MAMDNLFIDATKVGNTARFINHSCKPNCETQKYEVGGRLRLGIWALCHLSQSQAVTISYNHEYVGTTCYSSILCTHIRLSSDGVLTRCLCGSDNCQGFLGSRVETRRRAVTSDPRKKSKKPRHGTSNEKVQKQRCVKIRQRTQSRA
jgi:hypothetical protein